MKIFLVLSDPPTPKGEAVGIVTYEVIQQIQKLGHEPVVQILLRYPRGSEMGVQAEALLEALQAEGVEAYPILYVQDKVAPAIGIFRKALNVFKSFGVARLFPASQLGSDVDARVRDSGADVLMSVWSWEALAATYRVRSVPKLMYYGNPDHLPAEARLKHPEIFEKKNLSFKERFLRAVASLQNGRRKALHINMMKQCEMTVNNSILDAKFYQQHGHPDSRYLQNMWPVNGSHADVAQAERSKEVIKIIGSVGNLGATGNSFGLYYLCKQLMPELVKQFGDQAFEVHLLGKGQPTPGVEPLLDDPRIVQRGWVDDIDAEFRAADAFLILTNVSQDFLVGNTRLLLAWALKTPVAMHGNSALAMPEIEHGKNALLGETPSTIAAEIVRVSRDADLAAKLGEGGYATYQTYYRSDVVVPQMMGMLEELVTDSSKQQEQLV